MGQNNSIERLADWQIRGAQQYGSEKTGGGVCCSECIAREVPMKQSIVTQAQKLYSEASAIVAREVELKEQSGRNIVRLASLLKDLYEIFMLRRDSNESLVLEPKKKAFNDFRECMIDILRPLNLQERTGWYYVSIGRHLLGKIPEA